MPASPTAARPSPLAETPDGRSRARPPARSTRWRPGMSPTSCAARRRRPNGAAAGASPSRPAPATATATPGRSASTARMSSASGSAGRTAPSVPGALGIEAAAPTLFDAFARLRPETVPLPPPPPGALTSPPRRCRRRCARFEARGAAAAGGGPEIAFPPDGARVDLGLARGDGPAACDPRSAPGRRRSAGWSTARRSRPTPSPGRRNGGRTAPASSISRSSTRQGGRRGRACSCSEFRTS